MHIWFFVTERTHESPTHRRPGRSARGCGSHRPTASATLVGIYRNPMESGKSEAGRQALGVALRPQRLGSAPSASSSASRPKSALSHAVMAATSRSRPPSACPQQDPEVAANSAYLALNLRSGGGARYQFVVFPNQRKAQLGKVLATAASSTSKLRRTSKRIEGIRQGQRAAPARLQRHPGEEKGNCRIRAFVGGKLVSDVTSRVGTSRFSVGGRLECSGQALRTASLAGIAEMSEPLKFICPGGRPQHAADHIEYRGLAGAVGTDLSEHVALVDTGGSRP